MSNNGQMDKRDSVVVITGKLKGSDEEVAQELTLNHDPGAPDGVLIGNAFTYLRNAGGLMVDGEGGAVNFYPMSNFSKINFTVRKVQLARPLMM